MEKADIISEIKIIISGLIKKEHDYRVEYLEAKYKALIVRPKIAHFQLEESGLWMAVYSHINWLAHFRFLKVKQVDKNIPEWLAQVFGWPEKVAKAFWFCGRNPIAHTGNRSQFYSINIAGKKRYIQLSLDDPNDWNADKAYLALPEMKKGLGGLPNAIPAQQTIFFYTPIKELLVKLLEDIDSQISGFNHSRMLALQKVCESFYFIKDDGSLARMYDLLRVYKSV